MQTFFMEIFFQWWADKIAYLWGCLLCHMCCPGSNLAPPLGCKLCVLPVELSCSTTAALPPDSQKVRSYSLSSSPPFFPSSFFFLRYIYLRESRGHYLAPGVEIWAWVLAYKPCVFLLYRLLRLLSIILFLVPLIWVQLRVTSCDIHIARGKTVIWI